MKKILFSLALLTLVVSANATAIVTEKVLKAFSHVFPEAQNPLWYKVANDYEAYFDAGDVKCRARFDAGGKMIGTLRYYGEKTVSPFLKAKLAGNFPGKTIFGVTEVCSDEEVTYYFVLEDGKTWTTVKSDGLGEMEIVEKFKKA